MLNLMLNLQILSFMSLFNSSILRSSASSRNRFDLSGVVVGTHDFGVPYRPVFCRESVPGDKWSIELNCFARMASMVLPTYGNIHILNRFFYVPMQVIHRNWNEFMAGADVSDVSGSSFSRISPSVVTVSNDIIFGLFDQHNSDNPEYSEREDEIWIIYQHFDDSHLPSGFKYDYVVDGTSSVKTYGSFNHKGLVIYSILRGLGYGLNFCVTDRTSMSAMPLLAYAKICYDWLVDSNFVNSTDFEVNSLFSLTGGSLSRSQLEVILRLFSTCYEKDYFTAAWQSPNQVDSSTYSNPFKSSLNGWNYGNLSGSGNPSPTNIVTNASAATYTRIDPSSGSFYLSQYGLDILNSLTSFVKKHLLVGFRNDKLTEVSFDEKMNNELAHRSLYLGTVDVPMQISDVMSTSETISSGEVKVELGDYAGKGLGYEDGHIIFEPSQPEFGYIICLSAIVPDIHYSQGRNRELFHISRHDFFTPEFEQVGPQSIRNDELFVGARSPQQFQNGQSYGLNPSGIFGYSPRFSEYKCGICTDNIVGDYLAGKLNGDGSMDCYHLFRKFNLPSAQEPLSNTYSFKTTADSDQFKRIFNKPFYEEGNGVTIIPEHFNVFWNFRVFVERKMLPINDLRDLKSYGDTLAMKHQDDLLHG